MNSRQNSRYEKARTEAPNNGTTVAAFFTEKPTVESNLIFPPKNQKLIRSKSSSGYLRAATPISPSRSNAAPNTNFHHTSEVSQVEQLRRMLSTKEARIHMLQSQLEGRLSRNRGRATQLANGRLHTRQVVEQEMRALAKRLEAGDLSPKHLKDIIKSSDEIILILMKENEQLNELFTQKLRDVDILQQQMTDLEQQEQGGEEKEKSPRKPAHGLLELENKLSVLSMENELLKGEKDGLEITNKRLQIFSANLVAELQKPQSLGHASETILAQLNELDKRVGFLERTNSQLEDALKQKDTLITNLMNKLQNSTRDIARQTFNPNPNIERRDNRTFNLLQESRAQTPTLERDKTAVAEIEPTFYKLPSSQLPQNTWNTQEQKNIEMENWGQQNSLRTSQKVGINLSQPSARSTTRYNYQSQRNSRADLEISFRDSEENLFDNAISKSYEQDASSFRSIPLSQAKKAPTSMKPIKSMFGSGRVASYLNNSGIERVDLSDIIQNTQKTLSEMDQTGITYVDEVRSDNQQAVRSNEKEHEDLNRQEINSESAYLSKFTTQDVPLKLYNSQFENPLEDDDPLKDNITTNKSTPRLEAKEKVLSDTQRSKDSLYLQKSFAVVKSHFEAQTSDPRSSIQSNQNSYSSRYQNSCQLGSNTNLQAQGGSPNHEGIQNQTQNQAKYLPLYIPRSRQISGEKRPELSRAQSVLHLRKDLDSNVQVRNPLAPLNQQLEAPRTLYINTRLESNSPYHSQNSYIPKSQYLREKYQNGNNENAGQVNKSLSFQSLVNNVRIPEKPGFYQFLPTQNQNNEESVVVDRFDGRMGAENVTPECESGIEKAGTSRIKSNRLAYSGNEIVVPANDSMQTSKDTSLNHQPKFNFGTLFNKSEPGTLSHHAKIPTLKNLALVENQQVGRTITFGPSVENSPRVEFQGLERDQDSHLLKSVSHKPSASSNMDQFMAGSQSHTYSNSGIYFHLFRNNYGLIGTHDTPMQVNNTQCAMFPPVDLSFEKKDEEIKAKTLVTAHQWNRNFSPLRRSIKSSKELVTEERKEDMPTPQSSTEGFCLMTIGIQEPIIPENPESLLKKSTIAREEVEGLAGLCDKLREENQRLKELVEQSQDTIKNYSSIYSTFEAKSKEQIQEIKQEYENMIELQDQEFNELKFRAEMTGAINS